MLFGETIILKRYYLKICKTLKIKINLEIITNEVLNKNINENPRNISKIYDKKIDALLILDIENQKEILSQVPKRVQLNKKFNIFSLNTNLKEKDVLINNTILINQILEFKVH